jgi:formylglycine-generating enzyme required for sulfatase activity
MPQHRIARHIVEPDYRMITIPEGCFWMGSEGHYAWESPRHRVFIDAFAISSTAVSRREYELFRIAINHEEPPGWRDKAFSNPDQPAVGISWFDAVRYCDWLSESTDSSYRLPTEAEWEKACRGGHDDLDYAWGNEPPESFEYLQGPWAAPRPVVEWRPNGYGLFHMGDNIHEWCSDWYSPDYYAISPEINPTGPLSGSRRISRGGSWRHQVRASRAAHRSSLSPLFRYMDYGFRIVRA